MKSNLSKTEFKKRLTELTSEEKEFYFLTSYNSSGTPFCGTYDDTTFELTMQEHKSQIYNVNTESNGNSKLEERIANELKISPIVVLNKNKITQVQPADILDAIRQYSSSRSVFDEATTIPIDYSLLDIEEIKAEIERQGEIGSRQGIEIKPSIGDGDEIDLDETQGDDEGEGTEKSNVHADDEEQDYKGQFAIGNLGEQGKSAINIISNLSDQEKWDKIVSIDNTFIDHLKSIKRRLLHGDIDLTGQWTSGQHGQRFFEFNERA